MYSQSKVQICGKKGLASRIFHFDTARKSELEIEAQKQHLRETIPLKPISRSKILKNLRKQKAIRQASIAEQQGKARAIIEAFEAAQREANQISEVEVNRLIDDWLAANS